MNLHILAGHHNMVGQRLMLAPPTPHYSLESNGWAAYMETPPKPLDN